MNFREDEVKISEAEKIEKNENFKITNEDEDDDNENEDDELQEYDLDNYDEEG